MVRGWWLCLIGGSRSLRSRRGITHFSSALDMYVYAVCVEWRLALFGVAQGFLPSPGEMQEGEDFNVGADCSPCTLR